MLRRVLVPLLVTGALVAGGGAAFGGEATTIEVIVVSGPLDGTLLDFVTGAIESSDASVVVLQLDSSATLDAGIDALIALVADPPVPVAVYAGPAPATVSGGAVQLLAAASISGAAPGVVLGPARPTVAGGPVTELPDFPAALLDDALVVADDIDGFLDMVEPSIGQFVVGLDGRSATAGGSEVVLDTAVEITENGVESLRPSGRVVFVEPGLVDTTLRLGVGPEVAFFFLVAGLTLAVFEFYAAGPGVAAALAALCLLIAGYGIAVLPVQWWAITLVPVGLGLYTIDFQRNDLGWKSILGSAALLVGGLAFTDAAPQMVQTWWIVLVIVFGTALWFAFAMTTVVRSRFSTQTIGRDHLIGRAGVAETSITPEGTVMVDGARWRARSTRGSGIDAGDGVVVQAVDGITLEVDPAPDGS